MRTICRTLGLTVVFVGFLTAWIGINADGFYLTGQFMTTLAAYLAGGAALYVVSNS
jgi:hypothetical protein